MRVIPLTLCACLLAMGLPTLMAQEATLVPDVVPPVAVPTDPSTSQLPRTPSPGVIPELTRADVEAWVDGYLPYALDNGDIAGAVVVVVKDGQVLLQKGYGYADLEKRTPVDPAGTLFRPGSVSKLFTWTAVMQLVEQGKLDLDADVNQYIDFKIPSRDGKPTTLRQVMTHTTGLEEQIRGLITSNKDEIVPLDAALKRWTPQRIHAPGATPAYSNYATALAGYIVQRVSGEPFDAYIARHIFKPLGMAHSSFSQPLPPALLAKMSKGYAKASEAEAKDYEFISLAPAGSLAATGADMGRFMIAHLQDGAYGNARILRPETARRCIRRGRRRSRVEPDDAWLLRNHRQWPSGRSARWRHHVVPQRSGAVPRRRHRHLRVHEQQRPRRRNADDSWCAGTRPGRSLFARPQNTRARHRPGAGQASRTQMVGHYDSSRRPQSSLLSLANLLGQVKVAANKDGTISVPLAKGANGAPKKWREISPYLWQDVAGSDRLAADVVDGRVTRFTMEPYAPIMVFERLSTWRSLSLPLMIASLTVLLLTVLAWPVSALVRRYYRVPYGLTGPDARAHRLARLTALAVLLSIGGALGFVVAMLGNLEMTGPGSDLWINLLRLFATIVLPIGAALGVWNAWQVLRSRRRWLAKLWAVLLALSCLFLLWIGLANHVIGYGAYY